MAAQMVTTRKALETQGRLLVHLDAGTVARLVRLSEVCHDDPALIAASLIRDILEDDELMHRSIN